MSAKFQRGHPQTGRQIEVGHVKIGDFRPMLRYISEKVQDSYNGTVTGTRMRSVEWRYFQWPWVIPNYPKPFYFLRFDIAFHIFLVGGDRHFKFGR